MPEQEEMALQPQDSEKLESTDKTEEVGEMKCIKLIFFFGAFQVNHNYQETARECENSAERLNMKVTIDFGF